MLHFDLRPFVISCFNTIQIKLTYDILHNFNHHSTSNDGAVVKVVGFVRCGDGSILTFFPIIILFNLIFNNYFILFVITNTFLSRNLIT